jgi:hypothetical protein
MIFSPERRGSCAKNSFYFTCCSVDYSQCKSLIPYYTQRTFFLISVVNSIFYAAPVRFEASQYALPFFLPLPLYFCSSPPQDPHPFISLTENRWNILLQTSLVSGWTNTLCYCRAGGQEIFGDPRLSPSYTGPMPVAGDSVPA